MGRAFEFRKARKLKRWSNMAKTFTRIGREIVITVKEGGTDPSSNSRVFRIHQLYSSSVSPFQAKTGMPFLAIAAAA